MNQDILNLIIGFVLTTVLGGVLGSYLQQRSWNHQNEAHLKEEELKQASKICESVSQLLDKRLYRMRRLYFACQGNAQGSTSKEILEQRLQDYDKVLYEWNDRLNLNLALVGTYFGESARVYLHNNIYEPFKCVGSDLEQAYREVSQLSNAHYHVPDLLTQLSQLDQQVYSLGVFMMTQLRGGHVGRSAPEPLAASTLKNSLAKKN